jgi:hypothetical protein
MSRALPAHANLDHLRKQAKDRLPELQMRAPGSKLADAQHAIAREYGFASWPKLKAHVESITRPANPAGAVVAPSSQGGGGGGGGMAANVVDGPPPSYSFERYTQKARQALFFARYEASQMGSVSIEPEHVLLGLIRAGQGLSGRIFERVPLSLGQARADLLAHAVPQGELSSSVQIPFSLVTKHIFRCATEEANALRHRDIGIAHVLLGILRDERSASTAILEKNGMRLHTVRDDIAHLLNEEPM